MLADIAHGHVDGADILFLIAAIVFGVAAITGWVEPVPGEPRPFYSRISLVAVGLCLTAIAWLIL